MDQTVVEDCLVIQITTTSLVGNKKWLRYDKTFSYKMKLAKQSCQVEQMLCYDKLQEVERQKSLHLHFELSVCRLKNNSWKLFSKQILVY